MPYRFDTISIVGLGYIGLPTAGLFASRKRKVVGIDINPQVVDTVNQGKVHFVEAELDILIQAAISQGYLQASTAPQPADAFLVAVPTPFNGQHQPDLRHIQSAAQMIAPVLSAGNLVVLESTVPVGTTEQLAQWLAEARPDLSFPQHADEEADIQIAYCPERVMPGRIVKELIRNDRIIGGMSKKANDMAVALYRTFVQGKCITTGVRTAELCKLAENSFRDVNIAFANELSMVCHSLGVNVWELIELANHHPRVNILQPGAGVGGHCIAVDPWFIVSGAPAESKLIRTAREVNDRKPQWVLEQVSKAVLGVLASNPSGKTMADITVACLGLAFKPNIDDLRESPALEITKNIAQLGCQVLAVEPNIQTLPKALDQPNIAFSSVDDAFQKADVVCVLVKHQVFMELAQPQRKGQILIDAVGLWGAP